MADERVVVSRNKLEAVAAAIKEKTGEEGGCSLNEMPDKIRSISGGGGGGGIDGLLMPGVIMPKDVIPTEWNWIS